MLHSIKKWSDVTKSCPTLYDSMYTHLNSKVTLDLHLLTVTCGEEVMSRKSEVNFTINLKSMGAWKCVFNKKKLGDSYLISSFYGYVWNQTHYFPNQSRLCSAISLLQFESIYTLTWNQDRKTSAVWKSVC